MFSNWSCCFLHWWSVGQDRLKPKQQRSWISRWTQGSNGKWEEKKWKPQKEITTFLTPHQGSAWKIQDCEIPRGGLAGPKSSCHASPGPGGSCQWAWIPLFCMKWEMTSPPNRLGSLDSGWNLKLLFIWKSVLDFTHALLVLVFSSQKRLRGD